MWNQTLFYTSLVAALFMVFSLKFMELFSFIKWSPVGFLKNETVFPKMHFIIQWMILFILLFLVFFVLYILLYYLVAMPPSIPAIILSVLGVFLIEWLIDGERTMSEMIQGISIPLLSTVLIILRFLSGTASHYKELSKKQ